MTVASAGQGLTLVQYPGLTRNGTLSAPCGKVHMALAFKGVDYEVRNVFTPQQVKKYNPRGRVPALRIGGETVVDSTDILTELERRYPEPALEPPEPGARAAVKIVEDWADEVIYFYLVWMRWCQPDNFARFRAFIAERQGIPMRWIVPTVAQRTVRARVMGQGVGLKDEATIEREIGECIEAVETMLEPSQYLIGDRLTRADLAVVATLDQMSVTRFTPDLATRVGSQPRIASWRRRVHEQSVNAATRGMDSLS